MPNAKRILCLALTGLLMTPLLARAEDLVEFLNGSKARGTVKAIRKPEKEFDFEVKIGNRTLLRTYSYAKVHAVTIRGKRYVINKKSTPGGGGDAVRRSRTEIGKLVEEVGSTPPEWFEATPLNYPRTLDLNWPLKAPKGWNNQKNVGQFMWDVVNPNPGRWRTGIKLVHQIMPRHKDDPSLLVRDMKSLGGMYFRLFQDYPRAAFWLRKARVQAGTMEGVLLGESYFRMGNKQMALEMVDARRLHPQAIKLLGDLGETDKAVQLANAFARNGQNGEPLLLGGDACRRAGRHDQAIEFYQRVLKTGARNKDYQQRYHARARESIEAIRLFDQADVNQVADGTTKATSTGYNGPMTIEVSVAAGKIAAVKVTQHKEKQFYSALDDTPRQIIQKQSVRNIDATSRATITSQAIVNATAKALANAPRK